MKPVSDLLNKTFGRLTVISRAPNPGTRKNSTDAYWNCQCFCGKMTVVRSYALTIGKTKSCGCLKREAPHLALLPQSQPKYSAHEAAARVHWHSRYLELLFEDYYKLSRLNCYYCNAAPNLVIIPRRKNNTIIFLYNTLDRIDSSKGHIIDNVVPACLMCNGAKLDRSLSDFYIYINNLINNLTDRPSPQEYRYQSSINELIPLLSLCSYKQTAVKSIYPSYHDGELNLNQFYELIMSNCYYCGISPSNTRNMSGKNSSEKARTEGTILYSGLDRIDNNFPHNYDNVVPCCKYCNTAKSQLSIIEFDNWIIRLKDYLPFNGLSDSKASSAFAHGVSGVATASGVVPVSGVKLASGANVLVDSSLA